MKKKKYEFLCTVHMGEESVNVFSTSSEILPLFTRGDFIFFLPEWKVDFNKTSSRLKLFFRESPRVSIRLSRNSLHVEGGIRELRIGHTLPYLVHYILERERMKKNQMTLHAAAVSRNGRGIMILGKQGSGKTSIALELCRNYNCLLVGNDLVFAGLYKRKGYLFGGTKFFRVRETTVKYYNQDIRKFLKKKSDEWTNIAIITPGDIGVRVEKSPVPILGVFYVHLYPPWYPFCVKKVDLRFSRVYLHQICSEYIRGSAIIPLVGKDLKYGDYLPSLDSKIFFKKRTGFIDWVIQNKNYKYIAGSLSDICHFIDKHL